MKKHIASFLFLLAVLWAMISIAVAQTPAPLDIMRDNVVRILSILGDPKLKVPAAREAQKEKLRVVYAEMFDEIELSRRALGKHWNLLTVPQRKEFVPLFRQMLEGAYADTILDYTDEKVIFDRQIPLAENQVEVRSRIVTKAKEIPVAYRMILRGGAWRVYDVIVENISLVQNYRTQFTEILAKNTPEQLLEIMRKRVKDQ